MDLRIGLLGDLHLVAGHAAPPWAWHNSYDFAGVDDRVQQAVAQFDAAHVDAIALLGDLSHHGAEEPLRALGRRLAELPCPVFAVTGNHDGGGRQALEHALGDGVELADPAGVRVRGVVVAGVHVASGGWFGAALDATPDVTAWPEEPVVLLSHYPLLSHAVRLADRGKPYPGDIHERGRIAARLTARTAPTIVVSGHIHARDASSEGSVLQLIQAALVEPPYECSILEVSLGPPVSVRRTAIVAAGPEPEGELPVLVDQVTEAAFDAGRWDPSAWPEVRCSSQPALT